MRRGWCLSRLNLSTRGRDVARAGAWRTRDARSVTCAGRRLRVRDVVRVMMVVVMMFVRNDCGLRMTMMRVTMVTRTRISRLQCEMLHGQRDDIIITTGIRHDVVIFTRYVINI